MEEKSHQIHTNSREASHEGKGNNPKLKQMDGIHMNEEISPKKTRISLVDNGRPPMPRRNHRTTEATRGNWIITEFCMQLD
jgi:hypothetical protein